MCTWFTFSLWQTSLKSVSRSGHQARLIVCNVRESRRSFNSRCDFPSLCTETHRTVGQDSDRIQIAEDLSSAHRGHCPHGYWWSGSGVRSRSRRSLLLVKKRGDRKEEVEIWRKKKKEKQDERGAHFRWWRGENEWKRKIKTLFLKWDFFSK